MKIIGWIALVLVLLGGGFTLARMTIWQRPSGLGSSIGNNYMTPSVIRATLNGMYLLDRTTGGQSATGGFPYADAFSDKMNFELTWYDILAKKAYGISFTIRAKELSTFGDVRDHARVSVELGPGADVTVQTPDPEEMRLIGLKLSKELAALPQQPPVVLRELCATEVPLDDPVVKILAGTVEDWSFNRAMENRKALIEQRGIVTSRCTKE
ncbi:hypothetical protein BFP70_17780 [Thioclava sp. SK-1]|uniref:hypothetical protein n=1 Tax=Thioclava sp. SK-1 TaxID=1889770 RepID=UPI000825EF61|nr:hypothetical protein [Thioclava sp. SK-1]OCX60460.1 hypothetical protein BFP70_17780 [Thioclava sp. SK-1]